VTRLILLAGWRQLTRYRGQWLLSVLAIALGVAVVVAIDLANQSALRAFEAAHEVLSGRATHQLVGGPEGVDEAFYRRLRLELGIRDAAPVVEGRAVLPALRRSVTLLGLDPFAEGAFRGYASATGGSGDIAAFIGRPDTALLQAAVARELGVAPGQSFSLRLGAEEASLLLVGELSDQEPALAELVVVDIATAQELLGRAGRLSRVDLILGDAEAAALARRLPPDLRLLSAQSQSEALGGLTAAFRLNLTALSLLALLVGLFLIYNTLSFAVVRRRPIIGTMRALGVTRGEVLAGLLLEAALLGVLGTVLGLLIGLPLAQGLVRLVGRTVEALYYEQAVLALVLAPQSLLKAALLGIAGAVLAAWLPAREAANQPPRAALSRAALEAGRQRRLPRTVMLGAVLALAGAAVLVAPGGVGLGFVGLFAVVLGTALWVPAITVLLMHVLGGLAARLAGLSGRLASRGAAASLSRTGVAVTALAVAVSAVVGVGVMIHSFRVSVADWLEQTLQADFYFAAEGQGAASPLTDELALCIRALPGVAEVSTSRRLSLATDAGPLQLWALDLGAKAWSGFQFLSGTPDAVWQGLRNGEVMVSEPFAYRRALDVGDPLTLPTRAGPRQFTVAGVYRDYGSEQGVVAMHAATLQRWFGSTAVSGIGVYAAPGATPEALADALRPIAEATPGAVLRSQGIIKARSLEIFDQTFVITGVLRLLAGAVAFAGILAALAAVQLERAREGAVLRALGFTPGQLAGLSLVQSALLGLAAGLCALPIGVTLSGVLVHVILRRAFGWSMQFQVPAATLLEGLALALVAAVLAAVYPAWRGYRAVPAETLREES